MHCITPPRLPPVETLLHAARDLLKNRLLPALSAPGKRTRPPGDTPTPRTRRYALCSPRLCASLQRVLPGYGLMQHRTVEGTWYRVGSLTIRLTDSVVSLYAGTKTAVPLGLLTLIAAADPVLPDYSLILSENGEMVKRYLDYLTNNLHLSHIVAITYLVLISEISEHPAGVSRTDLAAMFPAPGQFRIDCQELSKNNLISITGDQITLTPTGTRIAYLLINHWSRGA